MDIFEDFEQMQAELRKKWLDYYEINRNWIKVSALSKGHGWVEVINGKNISVYCPSSGLIIGVVSTLDKRVSDFIQISIKLFGKCGDLDRIVWGLGLRFDPDVALEEREKEAEEIEEIQEAKLLAAGDEDEDDDIEPLRSDDLELDELRKEASQLISDNK